MQAVAVEMTLIGGPTVKIEIAGVTLLTDPTFDPPGPHPSATTTLTKTEAPSETAEQVGRIDAVLLSHDQHADNFDQSGRRFAEGAPVILTTEAARSRLGANSVGLKPWQTYPLGRNGELTITAVPARHGPPGAERTLGDVTGFLVSMRHEDLIYVTGDTVFYDEINEIARRYKPRIILAFAGAARTRGPYNLTMGSNDVLELAKAFPTSRIFAVHNRGWAHFTEGPDALAAAADAFSLGERVQSLVPGKKVDVRLSE